MKPIHATLLLMAGLLLLINSPLRAQDKPAGNPSDNPAPANNDAPKPPGEAPAAPAPPPPPVPQEGQRREEPRNDRPRGPQSRTAEEKAVPFIGVLTAEVSPELRAQFALQDGFGLQVVEVMPNTPAKTAGLKEHDILLAFDDQKLVNMEQLQTLVRSKKKDEAVSLSIISGGQRSQLTVTIGERMMPVNSEEGYGRNRFFPGPRSYNYDRRSNNLDGRGMESLEHFQEGMRDYQKRFNEWSRNRSGDMPTPPSGEGSRHRDGDRRGGYDARSPGGDRGNGGQGSRDGERRDFQRNDTVSRRDESGEFQLRRENDQSVFTVRPKEGAEQSWNISNDAERAAVPEPFRDKLKMLEDIRKDMRRDGTPNGPSGPRNHDEKRGPKDGERRPASDAPKGGTPPPPAGEGPPSVPSKGGTI